MPVAGTGTDVWNALRPPSVLGPKMPSTFSVAPAAPLLLSRSCSSLTAIPLAPICSWLWVPAAGLDGTWVLPGPSTTVSLPLTDTDGARALSWVWVTPSTMPSSATPAIPSAISFFWKALVAVVVAASNRPVMASRGAAPTWLSCCWMMPMSVVGPSPSLTRCTARACTYSATTRLPTCRCRAAIG